MTDKALEAAQSAINDLRLCECGHVRGDHTINHTRGMWWCNSPLSPCRYYQRRCDCKEFRPVRFTVTRVDPDEWTPQQKLDTLKDNNGNMQ